MTINGIVTCIDLAIGEPLRGGGAEVTLDDLSEWFAPGKVLVGLLGPELFWLLNTEPVTRLIFQLLLRDGCAWEWEGIEDLMERTAGKNKFSRLGTIFFDKNKNIPTQLHDGRITSRILRIEVG